MTKKPKVEPATTWQDVSRHHSLSRKTLDVYRTRADFPKTPDVEAVAEWLATHDVKASRPEMEELKRQKLEKENVLLEQKIARETRRVIPADEVRAFDLTYAAKLDAFLKVKLVLEVPNRLNGKSIADSRAEMERVLDEVRAHLRAGVMKWETEAA